MPSKSLVLKSAVVGSAWMLLAGGAAFGTPADAALTADATVVAVEDDEQLSDMLVASNVEPGDVNDVDHGAKEDADDGSKDDVDHGAQGDVNDGSAHDVEANNEMTDAAEEAAEAQQDAAEATQEHEEGGKSGSGDSGSHG